jgi:predicted small secreted protein
MRNSLTWASLILAAFLASGCDNDGPAERAGERIDSAADEVGDAVEDACEEIKEGVDAEDRDC